MKYYGLVMMSVTEFIVTVVAFLFLGRYVDQQKGGGSTYITVGTLVGFVLGMTRLYVRLKKVMDSPDSEQ